MSKPVRLVQKIVLTQLTKKQMFKYQMQKLVTQIAPKIQKPQKAWMAMHSLAGIRFSQ